MAKRTFSSFEYWGISFLLNGSSLDPISETRAQALKKKKIKAQEILRGLVFVVAAGVCRVFVLPQ